MINNLEKKFKIYIDFDGTVTTSDVGEEMFLKFGDAVKSYAIIDEWLKGKLNSKEVWLKLCETVKDFNEDNFSEFLNTIELDPYFKDFINFCSNNKFDVMILSDGLDYYINKITAKEKIENVKIFCNKLTIENNGTITPTFPFTDEECTLCANCKRNHILNSSNDEDITVYIGDGWSDTCAAQHCDFIFAKKSLLKYCENHRIPYYPFNHFDDVIKILNQIKQKKKIKKRHQAELKRREVYLQG